MFDIDDNGLMKSYHIKIPHIINNLEINSSLRAYFLESSMFKYTSFLYVIDYCGTDEFK